MAEHESSLATDFAYAVTTTAADESLIAKNGNLSLYSAYKALFPDVRPPC